MEKNEVSRILVRNGTLVDASDSCKEDLLIENGKILTRGKVDNAISGDCLEIDASGKYIIPGGIDPHVHLALPTPAGKSCDDFKSGSVAALAGGTTCFMDFVTPKRGQSLMNALKLRRAEASESLTGCGLHMGISEWNPAIAAEIIPSMETHGIRSFKAYLAYKESIGIGYDDLSELMQIVGPAGGLVMVHCEDGEMISRLQRELLSEGKTRPCYHALSHPPEAEIIAIRKVIELSARTGCPVYIVHISTRQGVEMVAAAKRDGLKVFAETCPHYLLFDDGVYDPGLDDWKVMPYVLSPPIRKKTDQQRLWQGLSDGTFDVVATDHCPFNLHGQKDKGIKNFTRIPNGAGGIRHRLKLLYTYGVLPGKISINKFVALTSTRPAEIFGLGHCKGTLLPGYDADIMIWNPNLKEIISVTDQPRTCDSEIYEGFAIHGGPDTVILSGKIVNRQS
ncbi:MAG: dihydropyrimidinase [Bacteroidales bacterium]